jgi:hypothetical protein
LSSRPFVTMNAFNLSRCVELFKQRMASDFGMAIETALKELPDLINPIESIRSKLNSNLCSSK